MLDEIPHFRHNGAAGEGVTSTDARLTTTMIEASIMADAEVTPTGEDSQHPDREIWKPVPSEPGVLASSWGRVLQAPGHAPLPNGGYRLYTTEPRYGQVSRASKTAKHEYRHVMLRRWGDGPRQQPRKVHQLVCEAFHGPKPFPEAVVMHLDEDAHNNRPENLRWGTQKENLNAPKLRASLRKRPHQIDCGVCGSLFEPRATAQRFCSLSCSARFNNQQRRSENEWRI